VSWARQGQNLRATTTGFVMTTVTGESRCRYISSKTSFATTSVIIVCLHSLQQTLLNDLTKVTNYPIQAKSSRKS